MINPRPGDGGNTIHPLARCSSCSSVTPCLGSPTHPDGLPRKDNPARPPCPQRPPKLRNASLVPCGPALECPPNWQTASRHGEASPTFVRSTGFCRGSYLHSTVLPTEKVADL